MQAQSAASLIARIISETAAALSGGPGPTQQARDARAQDIANRIRDLRPRSAIEAMLAANCVMFHRLMIDAIEAAANKSETSGAAAGVPAGLMALNNAFHRNLACFERARKINPEEAMPARPEIATPAGPVTATVPTSTAPTEVPVAVSRPAVAMRPEAARPQSDLANHDAHAEAAASVVRQSANHRITSRTGRHVQPNRGEDRRGGRAAPGRATAALASAPLSRHGRGVAAACLSRRYVA
jgi:hypothetical protein